MAKKGVSQEFIDKVTHELPTREAGPEAQLDYLLREIRSRESGATTLTAQASFMREIAIDAIQELERRGEDPEYITNTRRTMGTLSYSPMSVSGKGAMNKVRRIRRAVRKALGDEAVGQAIEIKRTVSVKIHWDFIRDCGDELADRVLSIVGLKKPTLKVDKPSKRALREERRKSRRGSGENGDFQPYDHESLARQVWGRKGR